MRSEEEIWEELEGKKKARQLAVHDPEVWEYIDTEIKVLEWVLGERPIC